MKNSLKASAKKNWICVLLNSNYFVKGCSLAHFWYVKAIKIFEKTKVNDEKNQKQK